MALMRNILSPALLTIGLLAGCGAISAAIPGIGGKGAPDLNAVSRSKIEAFGTPIMRATIPLLGIDTLLSPRNRKGDVVTWESADGYTFTFRSGILIETRGLGPDLMSASVPGPGQISAGSANKRSYFYTWQNDANERRDYNCSSATKAQEAVVIYGRQHSTRHVVESCTRAGGRMTNDYWFEGGTIRQSRQWISPVAGSVHFFSIVD